MADDSKVDDPRKVVKLTVNLSGDVYDTLKDLADQQGTTVTDALRKAIGTESFFRSQKESGSEILLRDKNKDLRQVLLR
jgi:hypothetical protein